jgi:glutamate-1-semialdehyde 2,1-aminomutase/spore coat polysaccharide biosynthesis protein SpsF
MNVLVITQARTGSTRLPNKVLLEVNNKSLLETHLKRITQASLIDKVLVATTIAPADDTIEQLVNKLHFPCYRGSENDVLDRFYQAAKIHKPKYIVRLTSDCPLIDPKLIDKVIAHTIQSKVDYCANSLTETFPDGQDVEVFTFESLKKAWENAKLQSEREHVTPYIRANSNLNDKKDFKVTEYLSNNLEFKTVRMTVDEPQDFEVIKLLIEGLGTEKDWKTYALYYQNNQKIKKLNNSITRNEGYLKSIKND